MINYKYFKYDNSKLLKKFLKKFELRTIRPTNKEPTQIEWVYYYSKIIFFSTVPSS